jgi:hypothetical protein
MRTTFLTLAVAFVSVFATTQQAIAKTSTKPAATSKKHQKKHKKTKTPSTAALTLQAAPKLS